MVTILPNNHKTKSEQYIYISCPLSPPLSVPSDALGYVSILWMLIVAAAALRAALLLRACCGLSAGSQSAACECCVWCWHSWLRAVLRCMQCALLRVECTTAHRQNCVLGAHYCVSCACTIECRVYMLCVLLHSSSLYYCEPCAQLRADPVYFVDWCMRCALQRAVRRPSTAPGLCVW